MSRAGIASPLAVALACACAGPGAATRAGAPGPAGNEAATAAFARLVDAWVASGNRFSPTQAVANGFHEHDSDVEDRSGARIRARIAELHALRAELAAIERRALGFDDAIDLVAVENDLRSDLLSLETLRTWEKNPMMYAGLPGAALDVLMKRDFAPGKERLAAVVARLRGLPAIFAAGRANVRNPPKEFTDVAIVMARGTVGFLDGPVTSWAREVAAGDAELLAELEKARGAALDAGRAFVAYLEKDLLPRSKGDFALGEARFLEKLAVDEMVELPLADLLGRGEAQLARDREAFVATARTIDATRSPEEVMALLESEHPTADDLVPSVARSVEAARRFVVERDLVTIPSEVRPQIRETPSYLRGIGFASMDTPGPFESRATEAFYYVEPVDPGWDAKHREEHLRLFNPPVVALINVHEAYPGHYVQFLYGPRFPTRVRKLVGSGTNVEGWAHYAEQMMVDEGFGGNDPRIRLAQLFEALLRDCRYVVGIRLHTRGMTVEDGARVFVERCFQQPANAYREARRGAFNPTYLYYTLGKMQIQELRDDYLARKGATLKQFHDAFVAQGGLPIPLVRRILLR